MPALAQMGSRYSRRQRHCIWQALACGAYSDRPQLAKAIQALGNGDTLVVCKLDRLARSTRDLLNTLDAIGKAGASFRSLSDQWADTTTPHGRLMLTVLGGLAEFELPVEESTDQFRSWEEASQAGKKALEEIVSKILLTPTVERHDF